jgi:hypothetical protein
MKDSDSVELNVTVPELEHRSAAVALGMNPLEAQIRQIYFLDTSDLEVSGSDGGARALRFQARATTRS